MEFENPNDDYIVKVNVGLEMRPTMQHLGQMLEEMASHIKCKHGKTPIAVIGMSENETLVTYQMKAHCASHEAQCRAFMRSSDNFPRSIFPDLNLEVPITLKD